MDRSLFRHPDIPLPCSQPIIGNPHNKLETRCRVHIVSKHNQKLTLTMTLTQNHAPILCATLPRPTHVTPPPMTGWASFRREARRRQGKAGGRGIFGGCCTSGKSGSGGEETSAQPSRACARTRESGRTAGEVRQGGGHSAAARIVGNLAAGGCETKKIAYSLVFGRLGGAYL